MLSVTQKINSDAKKTYRKVNSMFPENLPYIETQEAMQAYKKLMFHFGKKQIYDKRRGWITKRPHYNKKPRKCWARTDSSMLEAGPSDPPSPPTG